MGLRLARIGFGLAAIVAAMAAALVLAPGRAEATVTSCILTTQGIAFSPYNTQTKAQVDSTGSISVECSGSGNSNTVSIHLTGGWLSTACSNREMRNNGNPLVYNVYRNSTRTNTFCNGNNRVELTFSFGTATQQTQTVTMWGRVTSNQNPVYTATPYTDSLTATARSGTSNNGTVLGSTAVPISSMVAAICTISAGTLGFGSYSGATLDAAAAVGVNCSNGAPYYVALGGGNNQSGSLRRMAGPVGNLLSYQLYSDSARLTPWGDGSAQLGARRGGTGSGAAQSLSVYGRIPAAQSPAAGSYSDSVVVTIEY